MLPLQGLDHSQLRLLLRHTLTPWALRCPPGPLQAQWLLPLAHALLPHMHVRLVAGWADSMSSGSSGAPSALLNRQADDNKENKRRAATEEVGGGLR